MMAKILPLLQGFTFTNKKIINYMNTGDKITVLTTDYSWLHGIVTHVESNGFKVNGNPKYTCNNMEVLYSEHDIVGSLAKSYFGVPQDV